MAKFAWMSEKQWRKVNEQHTPIKPITYLPEVCIGQRYLIEGEVFVLFDIRATNVDSPTDFVIACRFKSEKSFFEENIRNVIGNVDFKLITNDHKPL